MNYVFIKKSISSYKKVKIQTQSLILLENAVHSYAGDVRSISGDKRSSKSGDERSSKSGDDHSSISGDKKSSKSGDEHSPIPGDENSSISGDEGKSLTFSITSSSFSNRVSVLL